MLHGKQCGHNEMHCWQPLIGGCFVQQKLGSYLAENGSTTVKPCGM